MSQSVGRVVLVAGASSGIGRSTAERLALGGWSVYALARQAPAAPTGVAWEAVACDITNEASTEGVVRSISSRGRLDAVVNCVGFGLAGAVEDTPTTEVRAEFEANVFGAWSLSRAAVAAFRLRGQGRLVHVGSLGGRVGMPFQAAYSASKFALAGLVESLSAEVRPLGIYVALVEPGNVSTAFTRRRQKLCPAGSAYRGAFERAMVAQERAEVEGGTPQRIARVIEQVLLARRPRIRYPVGSPFERVAVGLKGVLPDRVFESLLMRVNGVRYSQDAKPETSDAG